MQLLESMKQSVGAVQKLQSRKKDNGIVVLPIIWDVCHCAVPSLVSLSDLLPVRQSDSGPEILQEPKK